MAKRKISYKWHHFFIPHHETHQKAHLVTTKALIIYILFFLVLQFGFNGIAKVQPSVLGISADLNQQELIRLTNEQRQKNGLPPVIENSELNKAAEEKAKNMFAENYWAHYSPSGKSPWDFITGSGYQYSYAGENLARNFYTSEEAVNAWMASKMGHKENILNKNYKEIGMAVVEGNLNGQQTVLVVQEFGSPVDYVAQKPGGTPKTTVPETKPTMMAEIPVNAVSKEVKSVNTQAEEPALFSSIRFDPFALTKTLGFSLLGILAFLILLDLIIIKRRKQATVNLYTRHVPNFALLPMATTMLSQLSPGSIL
jgi:uncharacterized protein YkwD